MPHHDPGPGIVSVASGDAETEPKLAFQFVGAPVLRLAYPLSGPVTRRDADRDHRQQLSRSRDTRSSIGGVELACLYYKSPIRIEGVVPAGVAPGPVSIVAIDDDARRQEHAARSVRLRRRPPAIRPTAALDPASCAGAP